MSTLVYSSKCYDRGHILSYSAEAITESVHKLIDVIFKHSYGHPKVTSGKYKFFYFSTNGCKKHIVRMRKMA